jgi:hypothetical protein
MISTIRVALKQAAPRQWIFAGKRFYVYETPPVLMAEALMVCNSDRTMTGQVKSRASRTVAVAVVDDDQYHVHFSN